MSIDRELEHELEGERDANKDVPAKPDEVTQNLIQIEELAEATVAPGLFRLPTGVVSSSEDSNRWNIPVQHPTKGTINFRVDKPTTEGWVEDQELVQLLRWYGIHNRDPYELQTRFLYVEYKGDEADTPHGFELVQPPDYTEPEPPIREQLAERWNEYKNWRPRRKDSIMYGFMLAGVVVGTTLSTLLTLPFGALVEIVTPVVMFIGATILGLMVTEQ